MISLRNKRPLKPVRLSLTQYFRYLFPKSPFEPRTWYHWLALILGILDKKAHPWSEGAECSSSRFHIINQPHKCSAHAALPPFPYFLNTIASHLASYSHYSIYRTYQTLNTLPLNHHQTQNTQSLHLRLPKRTVPETITSESTPSSFILALLRIRLLYSLILLLIKSNIPYAIDLRLKKSSILADIHS